ncbi:MAG: peptidase S8, partial [Bacteroidota bacterium]|nr:peptidase S8 [Bacteroidota bacterium]
QLRYVIERSAGKPEYKVFIPGSEEKTNLDEISKTGGVVNAYEAIKLASTLKGERKAATPANPVKTRSIVKQRNKKG